MLFYGNEFQGYNFTLILESDKENESIQNVDDL